ncbi:hypothetical protein AB0O07_18605 [Streptomyces sp. NPDC093085]|uniref:hypothetical protein n=1 Tax=Streptomyces sp. NPDC093085 TaxID=3155068 RepID=UPI003415D69D
MYVELDRPSRPAAVPASPDSSPGTPATSRRSCSPSDRTTPKASPPGGCPAATYQNAEFLHEAYIREVTEPVGLAPASPEEILVVDHIPSGATEAEGIDVVFKGGEITRDARPLTAARRSVTVARWATLCETAFLCHANERDRIHSAHEAWITGRTAYLICGERFSARPP